MLFIRYFLICSEDSTSESQKESRLPSLLSYSVVKEPLWSRRIDAEDDFAFVLTTGPAPDYLQPYATDCYFRSLLLIPTRSDLPAELAGGSCADHG